LVVLISSATLAAVIGNRLSEQALAVLAGAVCGVGAAIPTSLLIVAVSRRRRYEAQERPPSYQGQVPPVIVVSPHGGPQQAGAWNGLPPSLVAPAKRQFTVVGGALTDLEDSHEPYS
jgi:hypothetical protein